MNKINFSYASDIEHSFAQRLIIKTIERVTGKKKLEKLYNQYSKENNNPKTFWSDILDIMNIRFRNKSKNKIIIPKHGPLMIIANHPFGIVDGLILCSIVSKVRNDFKIMTHETLKLLPQLDEYILPVDFSGNNKQTIKYNIRTASRAKKHLENDGVLIIFPSGSVSTAKNLQSEAQDDEWKSFPAKLAHQTSTDILPIYFDGKNGLLFHLFASKMKSSTLKYSSYIYETRKKIGKEIIIYAGNIIKYDSISHIKDRNLLIRYLKNKTYDLKNEI
tara:strand:- start:12125 stop:12949 length:825 start_codon:yes stop_codon:yes gene_type:complete